MGKKCNTCGEVKDRDDFRNDISMADGKKGDCKVCVKKKAEQRKAERNMGDLYHQFSELENEWRNEAVNKERLLNPEAK